MQSLVFCLPFPSPGSGEGAGSQPRALEASPQSSLGLLVSSLPRDVSGRLCAPASVSRPRCRRCVSGVCWVSVCTCTCLPLPFALCCAAAPSPRYDGEVVVSRLPFPASAPRPAACRIPRLHRQQEVALQGELEARVNTVLMELPARSSWGGVGASRLCSGTGCGGEGAALGGQTHGSSSACLRCGLVRTRWGQGEVALGRLEIAWEHAAVGVRRVTVGGSKASRSCRVQRPYFACKYSDCKYGNYSVSGWLISPWILRAACRTWLALDAGLGFSPV